MMMCWVRFTFSTSRTCGEMSPLLNPRSMMPSPPSSACTMAMGARVTVSIFADTIGRFSVMRCEKGGGQVDGGRIPPLEHAVLRAQEEVVERAASHQVKESSVRRHGLFRLS